jgi:hypothetical protein
VPGRAAAISSKTAVRLDMLSKGVQPRRCF